jgi:hypothetical protein
MGNERSNKNSILRHQRLEFLTALNSTFPTSSGENLRIFFQEAGDRKLHALNYFYVVNGKN